MRLATFRQGTSVGAGLVLGSGPIMPLHAACDDLGLPRPRSAAELMGWPTELHRKLSHHVSEIDQDPLRTARLPRLTDVELLPPMGENVLVVATSGNYLSHLMEMRVSRPRDMSSFLVSPRSLCGSGHPIQLPPDFSQMVDWEGEFCLVMRRKCYRVSPEEAMDCIGGYTLFNDVSARDWVAETSSRDVGSAVGAWRKNLMFKQFPSFGPIGPVIVTTDEIPEPASLQIETAVNGEVMQLDTVGHLARSFGQVVAELAMVYQFEAGDVITLGTPAGVGVARSPQRFLRAGDEVTVAVPEIGVLRNPVVT